MVIIIITLNIQISVDLNGQVWADHPSYFLLLPLHSTDRPNQLVNWLSEFFLLQIISIKPFQSEALPWLWEKISEHIQVDLLVRVGRAYLHTGWAQHLVVFIILLIIVFINVFIFMIMIIIKPPPLSWSSGWSSWSARIGQSRMVAATDRPDCKSGSVTCLEGTSSYTQHLLLVIAMSKYIF